MRPGLSRVLGFVDAVAGMQRVGAGGVFAHAGIDNVWVGFRHSDRSDGTGRDLPVGDGEPGESTVGGFPDAASGRAEIINLGLRRNAGDGGGASSAEGTDGAVMNIPKRAL